MDQDIEITFLNCLKAGYGKGEPTAQIMASLFASYFDVAKYYELLLKKNLISAGDLERRMGKKVQNLTPLLKGMAKSVQDALSTGNAQFFRDFAAALEMERRTNGKGNDVVRAKLLLRKLQNKPPKTLRELADELKRDSIIISDSFLRRLCKKLNIPILPDKQGRPKKKS